MKKILSSVMALLATASLVTAAFAIEAVPTSSTVLVNGIEVKVNAYNIDGNNYFKLRDVAYMLNGTAKQFEVGYNGALNSIVLTSKQPYTAVGGEMEQGGQDMKDALATTSKIIQDGVETEMAAYNIDGNNYLKLRELGDKFDFGVDYDANTNSVKVDTDKGYGEPDETKTTPEPSEKPITDSQGFGTDLFTPSIKPTPGPGTYGN